MKIYLVLNERIHFLFVRKKVYIHRDLFCGAEFNPVLTGDEWIFFHSFSAVLVWHWFKVLLIYTFQRD